MKVKEILDGIELVAARMRIWFASVLTLLVGFEALYASGAFDTMIPPGSKWAKWIPFAALLVARYTHGKTSANALINSKEAQDYPAPPK
jgi:hypothetical protein